MKRHLIAAAAALVLVFVVILISQRGRQQQVTPYEVFSHIQQRVEGTELDPHFVYAIAFAESSLRVGVETVHARGIMQISRGAWEDMTDKPYRMACNWRTNIDVGVEYLLYCQQGLKNQGRFSYPLLAASYRYGPNAVRRANFQIDRLPEPRNQIYKELFAGRVPRLSSTGN